MKRIRLEDWILIGICSALFFYYATYLYDWTHSVLAEGYDIPMTAIVVLLLLAPVLILYYYRKWDSRKFVFLLAGGLLLASFTGPKLSVILSLVLLVFVLVLVVVTARRR